MGQRRGLLGLVGSSIGLLLVLVWGFAAPVGAHTDFAGSTPEDGSVVERSVEEITVSFTSASEIAADGFSILSPNGEILRPPVERSDDGTVFTMSFDPPLTGGVYAVRWSVRAGDAHPIEGVFTFETTAPVAAPTTTSTTLASSSTLTAEVESTLPTTTAPMRSTSSSVVALQESGTHDSDAVTLEEFIGSSGASNDQAAGQVGRLLGLPSALVLSGTLAFVILVSDSSFAWTRLLVAGTSGLLLLGSGIEFIGVNQSFGDFDEAVLSSAGAAIMLRAVAALLGLLAFRTRSSVVLVGSALAALGSFQFDGHTVTEDPRWLMAAADVAHVFAASVWLGGVLCLALAHRLTPQNSFVPLAVRFSVVATGAVVAAGLAGIALAWNILDSFSDLWHSSWGQLLVAKTLLVLMTGGIGAINHFRLVPQIERADSQALQRLGRAVRVEAALLLAIALLTAVLVAASP